MIILCKKVCQVRIVIQNFPVWEIRINRYYWYPLLLNIYHKLLNICSQEATAEEVEFDDEEVGPEEVDDNKEYWVYRTE